MTIWKKFDRDKGVKQFEEGVNFIGVASDASIYFFSRNKDEIKFDGYPEPLWDVQFFKMRGIGYYASESDFHRWRQGDIKDEVKEDKGEE